LSSGAPSGLSGEPQSGRERPPRGVREQGPASGRPQGRNERGVQNDVASSRPRLPQALTRCGLIGPHWGRMSRHPGGLARERRPRAGPRTSRAARPGVARARARAETTGRASFLGAKPGDEREVGGIALCWCPPGRFRMGSPPDEPERRPGEAQVEVTLSKGFWIGKYEVTQGQWKRV